MITVYPDEENLSDVADATLGQLLLVKITLVMLMCDCRQCDVFLTTYCSHAHVTFKRQCNILLGHCFQENLE